METCDFPVGDVVKEVVPMTRRTKVTGFGVGLVLVGPVLVMNGLGALSHSRYFGYNLSDPLTIDVSSRAVMASAHIPNQAGWVWWEAPMVTSSATRSANSSESGSPVNSNRTHSGPMTVSMTRFGSVPVGNSPRLMAR